MSHTDPTTHPAQPSRLRRAEPKPELSDDAIAEIRRRRWQARVQRVLAVMREEGVDFIGAPFLTPDGRLAARVVPVEARQP